MLEGVVEHSSGCTGLMKGPSPVMFLVHSFSHSVNGSAIFPWSFSTGLETVSVYHRSQC